MNAKRKNIKNGMRSFQGGAATPSYSRRNTPIPYSGLVGESFNAAGLRKKGRKKRGKNGGTHFFPLNGDIQPHGTKREKATGKRLQNRLGEKGPRTFRRKHWGDSYGVC